MNKVSGIRRAVGGIILHAGEVLIVRKVKMMDGERGPTSISPEWDFPKGGIKSHEVSAEDALMRELHEELGAARFRVLQKLPSLDFQFSSPVSLELGFREQRTEMFLVELLGVREQLEPEFDEIDAVRFVPKEELVHTLTHLDSKKYIARLLEQDRFSPRIAA